MIHVPGPHGAEKLTDGAPLDLHHETSITECCQADTRDCLPAPLGFALLRGQHQHPPSMTRDNMKSDTWRKDWLDW